jgi:hypothetical protein
MREIVPLANLNRRIPEAGRIRTGSERPNARQPGRAIPTFRFTSRDQTAIEQVAVIYGGKPEPWKGQTGQWQVVTNAKEIQVVLPPDPLGGTPLYEAWSGGGCERRCDGLMCMTTTSGPDGAELTEVPCMCQAAGTMKCTPHTRLSVILPDVRFGGTWRYESATSWNVAQEMPGMVDLIQSLQQRGLSRALLAIEPRQTVTNGQTRNYTIPVLRVAETLDALASGAGRVASLPSAPPMAEIEAGDPMDGYAELVEEELEAAAVEHDRLADDEPFEAVIVYERPFEQGTEERQAKVTNIDQTARLDALLDRFGVMATKQKNTVRKYANRAGLGELTEAKVSDLSETDFAQWEALFANVEEGAL